MTQMLDCMVSFFGLNEKESPDYRRYFCYHILAGPGPTNESGVASIMILAVHDESERCTSCRHFHAVESGGPAAAIAAAVRYLDSYHHRDHLWKVQSNIRGLRSGPASSAAPPNRTELPRATGTRSGFTRSAKHLHSDSRTGLLR